ncbi:hypothetical protein GCM10017667_53870 [Streptomyces filamentosus]|uniref:Uncharacterized protein n=1 Tax=Streptomyces filamentosus TaxID=67294 RepID=A0A919BU22_STRFL|nr:hypothetical protein GCM10017667_53870 [Streptomyces filamentosus]
MPAPAGRHARQEPPLRAPQARSDRKPHTWDFDNQTGPEFAQTDCGEYILEGVALTTKVIADLNRLPEEISTVLCRALEGESLVAM